VKKEREVKLKKKNILFITFLLAGIFLCSVSYAEYVSYGDIFLEEIINGRPSPNDFVHGALAEVLRFPAKLIILAAFEIAPLMGVKTSEAVFNFVAGLSNNTRYIFGIVVYVLVLIGVLTGSKKIHRSGDLSED
jgi:hypothetical protein